MASLDIFNPHKKERKIQELPLNAILDVFVTIIFFLLLGSTFQKFTQESLPPSQTVTVDTVANPAPLNPKFLIVKNSQTQKFHLVMTWAGETPGVLNRELLSLKTDDIKKVSDEMFTQFDASHKGEDTLQVGLGGKIPYHALINVMDGLRERNLNIALLSPADTEIGAEAFLNMSDSKLNGSSQ